MAAGVSPDTGMLKRTLALPVLLAIAGLSHAQTYQASVNVDLAALHATVRDHKRGFDLSGQIGDGRRNSATSRDSFPAAPWCGKSATVTDLPERPLSPQAAVRARAGCVAGDAK